MRETDCLEADDFGYCNHLGNDIRPLGTWYRNFYNLGRTGQQNGRVMVSCGLRTGMRGGPNSPDYPSLVQEFRAQTGAPAEAAWVIAASNEPSADWSRYPLYDGRDLGPVEEFGLTEREVVERIVDVAETYAPRIIYAVFQTPDEGAQYSDTPWEDYTAGIDQVDRLAWELEQSVRAVPGYGDKTTIFYTDFHGRHTDKVDGHGWEPFQWHGDSCAGCRNVTFIATGPDIPAGVEITRSAELIDIHATMAWILGVHSPQADGRILYELFDTAPPQGNQVRGANSADDLGMTPPDLPVGELLFPNGSIARLPDVQRIGPDYFITWTEARADLDGNAWDVLLSRSTDNGLSWSAPEVVVAANDTLRPWQSGLAGDADEGLIVGVSTIDWSLVDGDYSWAWKSLCYRIDPHGTSTEPLPRFTKPFNYIQDRPAVVARDGAILSITSNSAFNRQSIAWLPGHSHPIGWAEGYQWNQFGYTNGLVMTADSKGPIALETLRSHETGKLNVTRQHGKSWGSVEPLVWEEDRLALQPTVGATGDRVIAAWVDNENGISDWELRCAYTDNAPTGWSTPIDVAPGTGSAWHPDIWVEKSFAVLVWEDFASGDPGILLSESGDGGQTWSKPMQIATGSARFPRIAARPGSAIVTWEDMSGTTTFVRVTHVDLPY